MSKYILEAINMSVTEAKTFYGRARPTNKNFYEEVRRRSEAWTDLQSQYYDTNRNDTMIKLYDWLLQCEVSMIDLNNGQEVETGKPFLTMNSERTSHISNLLNQES